MKLHEANRMVPSVGAYSCQKYPKPRSESVQLGPRYRIQLLACRAISASADLLAISR